MIPIKLKLVNFLSYHEPVEVDFTPIHIACISGSNGAGKSSLLDAMTFALFGKARKVDDSLIFGKEDKCEVTLDFEYEGSLYRIIRSRTRGKTGSVDFYIQHAESGDWKPLSESKGRDTGARIEQVLHMDYETFTNASFFLQGKADQFAQQKPGDRKRILGSILGLDAWDSYKEKATEKRKVLDGDLIALDARMREIRDELDQEDERKRRLEELSKSLKIVSDQRKAQETTLDSLRQQEASAREQKKLLDTLTRQLEASQKTLADSATRLQMRQNEQAGLQDLLSHADKVEADYAALQKTRQELEGYMDLSMRSNALEKQRSGPQIQIEQIKSALMQEQSNLQHTKQTAENILNLLPVKQKEQQDCDGRIKPLQDLTSRRQQVEIELSEIRTQSSNLQAENARLKEDMIELDVRRKELLDVHSPSCPLCGQDLTPEHLAEVLEDINLKGKEKGDLFRQNELARKTLEEKMKALQAQLDQAGQAETEIRVLERQSDQLKLWIGQNEAVIKEWQTTGLIRLEKITHELEEGLFAQDARNALADFDRQLAELGYDRSQHELIQKKELSMRVSEQAYRELDRARSALAPLEREIAVLMEQIQRLNLESQNQTETVQTAGAAYTEMSARLPNILSIEAELNEVVRQENALRKEVGGASQMVDVLDNLRLRLTEFTSSREVLATQIGRYKSLEKAFGKDGVPGLIIEQALPEIEIHANEILDRLSNGAMNIRFLTQRDFKAKNREDKKETLDITISDQSGVRDYELFSGGEAFRVNFAIRLALSRVLAQRAGARLQTLVIDEGFGSQDSAGRQRLTEAINMVKDQFARVLVITHMEELKDNFQSRIEVEKLPVGSTVRVMV